MKLKDVICTPEEAKRVKELNEELFENTKNFCEKEKYLKNEIQKVFANSEFFTKNRDAYVRTTEDGRLRYGKILSGFLTDDCLNLKLTGYFEFRKTSVYYTEEYEYFCFDYEEKGTEIDILSEEEYKKEVEEKLTETINQNRNATGRFFKNADSHKGEE